MDELAVAGFVILGLADLVTAVVVLALARELGVISVRLGPPTTRDGGDGPPIGSEVEAFAVEDIRAGGLRQVSPNKGRGTLLVFVSPHCTLCATLMPGVAALAGSEREKANMVVISSGDRDPKDERHARLLPDDATYACRADLHEKFGVLGTPYVVVLDSSNKVTQRGIANNLQQLESLFGLEHRTIRRKQREIATTP